MDEQLRMAFEKVHCGGNSQLTRRDSTSGDYVLPCIRDAWAGFQSHADWQARASLIGQPPEGWKLVPIEPTDEMIDAFCNTPKMKVIDGMIATAQIRGGYADARLSCETKQDSAVGEGLKAALAAAPQPTVSNKIDKPD